MRYAIAFLLLAGAATATAEEFKTKEVVASINDVYVPGGFSSDADAYVVLSGVFPNSCYRFSRGEVKHTSAVTHDVAAIADVTEGMCLMVMVPWTKDVNLGRLGRGNHTLRFRNGDGTYFERNVEVE